jgi:hypothetical protein
MLGDKLPRFRGDLRVDPKPDSKGLFEVTDVTAGKHFTLYDFELSMARMMDGKRTAQQVLESSTRLAIPVTIDGLEKFVRQLRAYGFVEDGSEATNIGAAKTWEARDDWDPALRDLFTSALVKLRQNRFTEAREYLEAMLNVDKENKEAQEVLAEIAEREKNAPAPPLTSELPAKIADATAVVKKLPKWAFGAAGGGLLLLVLLIPFPRTLTASVSLEAGPGVAVTTSREVVVKEAATQDGKWVDSGAALLKLDTSERDATLKKLEAELADNTNKLSIAQKLAKKKGAKPQVVARAKELQAKVDESHAALEKVRVDTTSWVISAPASGLVSELKNTAGARLMAGEPVARITDPRKLKVVGAVDGRGASALAAGQKIAATVNGHSLEVAITAVEGSRAVGELPNDGRVFNPGDTGSAIIKVPAKSMLGRLFW